MQIGLELFRPYLEMPAAVYGGFAGRKGIFHEGRDLSSNGEKIKEAKGI